MKKTLKKVLVFVVIIVANFMVLINTVQAVENGEEITIYSKGYFNKIIQKSGIAIKTTHAVYQENGKEYPVYCLNRELPGVGEISSYNVKSQGGLQDLGLWRVITNGYPYKSLGQLGVASEEEAYIATKQAVYCYIYNTDLGLYSPINDAGIRTIGAMKQILENARNSTETFETPNVEIIPSEKWIVDENATQYISKTYEIKSNKNISKVIVNLESQPKDTKIVDLLNQEKNEFDSNEKFKILIPIKSLSESGKFNLKVKTPVESKPVLFGKAPSEDVQNYALTAYSFEDVDSELVQEYEKNETKIIIEKTDAETKEKLKGAKFEILDENQKIIRVVETDEEGRIIMNQLMPGTYYIREVKSPNGYAIDSEMKKIDIKMNEEALVEVENEKIIVTVKTEPVPEIPEKVVEVPVVEKVIVEIPKLPVTGM